MDDLLQQLARTPENPEAVASMREEIEHAEQDPEYDTQGKGQARAGKHDPRNPLNELTGSEWVFFLNSVETTAYPTRGPGTFAHEIRKIHPSPKPPQLMSKIVRFFTKSGGWVLDPFMGVGGTLLGCSISGRNAVGIELEQHYIDAYLRVCEQEKIPRQPALRGDARDVVSIVSESPGIQSRFDLVLTDPPYGDMMARGRTGQKRKRTGVTEATPFSQSDKDLGNLPLEQFLPELRAIIESSVALLKKGGYCIVFCKDLQPTPEHHNMLHADVVQALVQIENLSFKGYKIWYDKTPNLYPFGYPFAFVANQLHQFILIFRKEA